MRADPQYFDDSELLYYLDAERIGAVAHLCHATLQPGGEVALLHWRHPSADYPSSGPAAHCCFLNHRPATPALTVTHDDPEFLLCLFRAP